MARANLAFCASIFPRNRVAAGDFRHEAVLHEAMARMAAFGALLPLIGRLPSGRTCPEADVVVRVVCY
jgi:hypothetical protein